MNWKRVSNSNDIKPLEVDDTSSQTSVYIRRNFTFVEKSGEEDIEIPAHWEWDECILSKEQYAVYKDMKEKLDEQEDAILELADIVGGML